MTSSPTAQSDSVILHLGHRSVTGYTPNKETPKPTKHPQQPKRQTNPTGRRSGFPKRGRNRLIKTINDLTQQPELMLTLTYTDDVSHEPITWKKHLDNLRRAMVRKFPHCWWIWRIEPQTQTGKPHYHLVGSLGQQMNSQDFWYWVHPHWCRIIGVSTKSGEFATRVKAITTDMEKLSRYMTKHESQSDYHDFGAAWSKMFKRWGILGRNNAPIAQIEKYAVSPQALEEAKDIVLRGIDEQMNSLREKLEKSDSLTPYADLHKMKKSLTDKQELKNKITHLPDWFCILDSEYVASLKAYLKTRADLD